MNVKNIIPVLLISCLFMLFSSIAKADSDEMEMKNKNGLKWEAQVKEIHQQLDLSEHQQEALEKNRVKYQVEAESIYENICDARQALDNELQQPIVDKKNMQKLHNEIKKLKMKKEDLRFNSIMEVRNILSAEQFQKFMMLKEELKTKHKPKFNH